MSFLNCSSCLTREFVAIGREVNNSECDVMGDGDDDALVYLSGVIFWICSNRTGGENGPVFGAR